MEDLEERFDRITFEPRYDDREEELSELVSNMPKKILNEIRIQVRNNFEIIIIEINLQQLRVEEAIIQKYPDCEDCHLEIDTDKNYHMDADEYTKDHLNMTSSIKMQCFEEEIIHIVQGDFMFDEKKKRH